MKTDWKEVRLGEVIAPARDTVGLLPDQLYKQITIRMNHKGICERGLRLGSEIGSSQFLAAPGQFIISRIDARNGAMGLVPEELAGAVVTNDFLLFNCLEDEVMPSYLDYLSHTAAFDKECQRASEGTTNRVRLQLAKFYNITIPLPPLAEQQRIVAKLDAVKANLAEVARLRTQQDRDMKALLFAHYTRLVENAEWLPMREVAPITRRPVAIDPDLTYPELGIRSFGKGTFHKPPMTGSELTWQKPVWLKAGDLVMSNIKAWEGAVAVVQPDDDGRVGSHRYIACVPSPAITSADFLFYYFQTPEGNEKLNAASPGSADRNRTLNTKKLADTIVPIPSPSQQAQFLALREKLLQMQAQNTHSAALLAQLMPSLLAEAFGV